MLAIETHHNAQPAIFHGTTAKVVHRLKIMHDDSPDSPREWDNLGTMYCEHGRYNLGDKDADDIRIEDEETGELSLPDKGYTILPLYLYDHSGVSMSTGRFSCPWDSGCVGYIYVSDEKARKEYGWKVITEKRRQGLRERLRSEVSTYDQYLRGDVYGYWFESFAVYDDGREESLDDSDSCWGFYGSDPAENGMAEHLPVDLADCEVTEPWS